MTWHELQWSYADYLGYEIGIYEDGSEQVIGKAGEQG